MLKNKWIMSLTGLCIANLSTPFPDSVNLAEDPIAAILEQYDTFSKPDVEISYGWMQLDGLPEEALQWQEVDAELLYVMRVSNNTGRSIDHHNLEFAEVLPEGLILSSADFDGTGPIQTSFEFVSDESGVVLLPGDVSYSSDLGETYEYEPTGEEYDEAIGAIRVRPRGVMNPGSSFLIRFKARFR